MGEQNKKPQVGCLGFSATLQKEQDYSIMSERINQLHNIVRYGLNIAPADPRTKHPLVEWSRYHGKRITEELVIDIWHKEWPDARWCVLTGRASGVVVVDADDERAEEWVAVNLPPTPITVKTRDGRHFYYKYPTTCLRIGNRVRAVPGDKTIAVDVRADEGIAVAPVGDVYKAEGWTPEAFAAMPVYDSAWFPLPERAERADHDHETDITHAEVVKDAAFGPVSARKEAARKHLAASPGAVQGGGANPYCFALACALVWDFALPASNAEDLLAEWGQGEGQQRADGGPYPWTAKEIADKVRDAIAGGPGDRKPGSRCHAVYDLPDWPYLADKATDKKKTRLIGWDQLQAIAASQQDRWIVEDILEPGTLSVLSGLPYSGKTTIVSQLIACVASGRAYLGFRVAERVPIVFVNADRLRERVVVRRISSALRSAEDHDRMRELFNTVPGDDMPAVCSGEYVRELLAEVGRPGLLIVDPLRAAFMQGMESGSELDATVMTNLLAPLRRLSREQTGPSLFFTTTRKAATSIAAQQVSRLTLTVCGISHGRRVRLLPSYISKRGTVIGSRSVWLRVRTA